MLLFYCIQTVQVEAELETKTRYSQDLQKSSEYGQSMTNDSLYCIIQNFHKLSLANVT